MAYLVLARKYRSRTFDEVVGQEHVAKTLKKAIESGRIAHAYLFSGTRGVGKTSMARILAKGLNCEKAKGPTSKPCLQCDSCKAIARGEDMDVIEIDAASNTQVDKTREVILDNAQYRPARGRFKIYIIDEVHMLSKASFNALLKTLEEPPEHVKFILATTEPEKVLPTILSRCQRYDFRNIPTREIAEHLKNICKEEQIKADEDALILVAKAGAGSMRDSLSLLDRLLSVGDKHLTVESVEQLLGLPHAQRIFDLVQAIGEGRVKDVLMAADKMVSEGMSVDSLIVSLVDHLRNLLVIRTCGADSTLVEAATLSMDEMKKQAERFEPTVLTQDITILEDLRRQLRQTQAGRALLDATLVRLALSDQFTSISELLGRVNGGGNSAATPASAGQKKKFEPVRASVAPPPPAGDHFRTAPGVPLAACPPVSSAGETRAEKLPMAHTSGDRPEPHPRQPNPPAVQTPAPAPVEEQMPAAATVPDVDEDDDLPRPGRVWEGPNLGELLKQSSKPKPAESPAAPPAAAAAGQSNVAPLGESDLKGIWASLLEAMRQHGMGVYSLLIHGQLAGIVEGQAVIRYGPQHETFTKMLARNGKRELVSEELSRVMGKAMGVRFELSEEEAGAATNVPAEPAAAPAVPVARKHQLQAEHARPEPAPIEPPRPVAPTSTRVTPQQLQEFERDPLIGALMSELGATAVKISEDV